MKPLVPRRRFRLLIVHAVPCFSAGILNLFAEPHAALFLGSLLATCAYSYLIWTEYRYQQLALTPLTCFLSWFGLVLGPTTIYIALRFSNDPALAFLIWLVPMQAVAAGYVITLLGAWCLHLGILLGLPERASRASAAAPEPSEHVELTIPALFACVAISVVFAIYAKSLLFIGSTFGYVLAGLGPAAACLYASSPRCGFRQKWVKLLILLPVTVLLAEAAGGSGSKLVIFSSAIPLLWFFLAEPGRRKYLLATGPVIASIFLLVVAPAVNQARLSHGSAKLSAQEILQAGSQLPNQFQRDPGGYLLQSLDYAAQRLFIEPVAVGYIVTRVEAEGYLGGRGFAYLAWAPIPRLLWPDKPLVSRGEWFTSETGFSMNEEASTTSTGMTSPGELYWNFGWAGVAIGMALLGYLISLLWRLALPDPRASLILMLPYVHLLGNFMLYQDSEAGSGMLNLVQAYIVFAVLARIVQSSQLVQKVPYPIFFASYQPAEAPTQRR